MKIINLGILAHVDAGKTTLTESLLYTSGAIAEPGSVDKGTTRTDTMNLERQRGITIQTAVTSFQWEDVKVNIIDTPGHMDFLAEVYRSLSVLDGAVLLVSAKDGIQAQTRILFHALQTMKIPTIFFINKIDQEGIDLPMVYQEMKAKLSSEIIVKQKVGQHPHINVTDNDDMEQWDAVIMGNDELLEKYMSGKPFKMSELEQEENRRFQNGTLFPVYHGSAKNNLGIRQLIEVIASKFYSSTPEGQSELCGQVFKIEYSEKRRRFVYVRIYSGTLHLRDVIRISESDRQNSIYVGSYGRGTAIDTSDIDILMSLPESYYDQFNSVYGNGQSRLLQAVRQAILVPYPRSEVRADGQVVKINFSDGMFFEILPAFRNWDGSYRYPDTNMGGNWRSTNPKAEQDAMKNKNISSNGLLFDTCKHLRYVRDNYFRSYHLSGIVIDSFVYQAIGNWRWLSSGESSTSAAGTYERILLDCYNQHFMWGAMPLSAPGSNQQVSTDNSRDCLGKVLRYIAD